MIARQPGSAILLINAGFALFDAGRLEEARLRFEQSLQADPSATIAHYGLGLVGTASGDHDDARLHYQAFLRSEPPDSKWAGLARESLRELSR
jgi:tetratricopeptide (TPR) repeat protein